MQSPDMIFTATETTWILFEHRKMNSNKTGHCSQSPGKPVFIIENKLKFAILTI